MATSLVQTLFDDALDTWSPVKTMIFMDNEMCSSPMMDYIIKTKKPDVNKSKPADGRRQRRCRTLRRTSDNEKSAIVQKSSCEFLQDLENSPVSKSEMSAKKDHDFGCSLLLDEGSCDSGVRVDEDCSSENSLVLPAPVSVAMTSRVKLFEEDACSPIIYSPIKSKNVPIEFPSFTPSGSDDGFFEDIAAIETDDNVNMPGAFASLFKAPMVNNEGNKTEGYEIKKPICLKLTGQLNSLDIRTKGGKKRQICEVEDDNPFFKRRRGAGGMVKRSCSEELPAKSKAVVPMRRYQSEKADIIKALDRAEDNPDLIADGSVAYCLPTVPGKHQDLKSITQETLSKVLNHEYDHIIEKYVIIDCRYPYEFDGGHIKNGLNYYTKDLVMTNLLDHPIQPSNPQKRVALIFHCEFSSERAPKMSRFLRNMDRDQNKHCYPHLYYPEIYLLHGGYKNFFETQQELCHPQTYMPMLHEDYKDEMRRFRLKSKSWAGDRKTKSARGRLGF